MQRARCAGSEITLVFYNMFMIFLVNLGSVLGGGEYLSGHGIRSEPETQGHTSIWQSKFRSVVSLPARQLQD